MVTNGSICALMKSKHVLASELYTAGVATTAAFQRGLNNTNGDNGLYQRVSHCGSESFLTAACPAGQLDEQTLVRYSRVHHVTVGYNELHCPQSFVSLSWHGDIFSILISYG